MSTYYTQEQLDSIGVLIANKIASNGEELKQFVQDKIDALEPVAPPAPTEPEAGGGTTPAPAAGMFLDDGREIKTKLIEIDSLVYQGNAYARIDLKLPQSVKIIDFISMSVRENTLKKSDFSTDSSETQNNHTNHIDVRNGNWHMTLSKLDVSLMGTTPFIILVTYLA